MEHALDQARAAYPAGGLEQARTLLRDAIAAAKTEGNRTDEMSALSLLGKVSMQLRQWPDAADAFQRVVELEEASFSMDNREQREALSNAYNNLGIARKNTGQMREALEALNSAYLRATNGDDQVATSQAAQILQNIGSLLRTQKKSEEARRMFERALEIGQRIFGCEHSSNALNHMAIARCQKEEGKIKEAIVSYTKAVEIWEEKDSETCLAEMPEVPSQERLVQVQQQVRAELAQLVTAVEQARQRAVSGAEEQHGEPGTVA